ncbi:MAG TPA: hypothetical protein ENI05_11245 [Porticoccus sp.]|nr:hypothetical protein [Porticoccus sp.]
MSLSAAYMAGCRLTDINRHYTMVRGAQKLKHWVGAQGALPRQLDLKAPNPLKGIIIEPSLDPKSRFTDYNQVLKKKTFREYGLYIIPEGKLERPIPLTTPAIVLDYTQWLGENNALTRRGADPRQEEKLLAQLRANRAGVMSWFDAELAKAGIAAGTPRHTQLLRTTVIPKHLALNFWTTAGKQAIRLDSAKMVPGLLDNLKMLGGAFWEATKDLLKKGKDTLGWLLTLLKWMAIAFGIGLGGLIILNIVQAFGDE